MVWGIRNTPVNVRGKVYDAAQAITSKSTINKPKFSLKILYIAVFKPAACCPAHTWFLEIAFVREVGMCVYVCLWVCLPPGY